MESKQVLGLFIIVVIVVFTFWFAERYHQYLIAKYANSIAKTATISNGDNPAEMVTRVTATRDRAIVSPCHPLYPLLRAIKLPYRTLNAIIKKVSIKYKQSKNKGGEK